MYKRQKNSLSADEAFVLNHQVGKKEREEKEKMWALYLNSLPEEHNGLVLDRSQRAYCDPWGNARHFLRLGNGIEEIFATSVVDED